MFDYVRTQLSSNCITTFKRFVMTKPAPKKAGFVFYLFANALKNVADRIALATDATMTANTAIS